MACISSEIKPQLWKGTCHGNNWKILAVSSLQAKVKSSLKAFKKLPQFVFFSIKWVSQKLIKLRKCRSCFSIGLLHVSSVKSTDETTRGLFLKPNSFLRSQVTQLSNSFKDFQVFTVIQCCRQSQCWKLSLEMNK